MCGICGIVAKDPSYPIGNHLLTSMRDTMVHRGPDDAGSFVGPGVGLGACRLAVLDPSPSGHIPMSTEDGRYWIVYNGKIYNYRELRGRLSGPGARFRSNTDTEVVLHLYAAEGPRMLEHLNGMFAIAIWDTAERTLFLARDRLGVKPIYYALGDGVLLFGSEEKALFAAGLDPSFDTSTWEELLCFRYVAGEGTPYLKIRRLLPGYYLQWKDGSVVLKRWWNLSQKAASLRERLPPDPARWFREVFDDAVSLRRLSDVPVGVLLSGGLDSTSVVASLAAQGAQHYPTFTVRFPDASLDEGPLARQVAESSGFQYHEMVLTPEELGDELEKASWYADEPLAHGSDVHMWAVSRHAKPQVTVLLSGEGADETLGGYVRYKPLRYPLWLRLARPLLVPALSSRRGGGRWRKLARLLALGTPEACVLFNACDALPNDLRCFGLEPTARFEYRRQVLSEAAALYPGDLYRQAMYCDQHTFLSSILDRNDRMTMAASVEFRVPFLDRRLIEGLAALPTRRLVFGRGGKSLLRAAIGSRLPAAVRRRRKWGFGVPWTRYFRSVPRLRDRVTALPESRFLRSGPFQPAALRREVEAFLGGDNRHQSLVWMLVMMDAWAQACLSPAAARRPSLTL